MTDEISGCRGEVHSSNMGRIGTDQIQTDIPCFFQSREDK